MATVIVNWTTKAKTFAGTVVGGAILVQILAADGVTGVSPTQNVSGNSASFAGINPGNYVAKVDRYDSAGNTILGSATVAFSVAAPSSTVEVPDVVTVSMS